MLLEHIYSCLNCFPPELVLLFYLDHKLGIDEKDAANSEVPLRQLLDELPHDGNVRVQLDLTWHRLNHKYEQGIIIM